MPRDIEIRGLYVPTLLLLFVIAAALQWGIDSLLGRLGWFGSIWHPPLFRLALFVCLFAGTALAVYR
jgi:hypothetical protein